MKNATLEYANNMIKNHENFWQNNHSKEQYAYTQGLKDMLEIIVTEAHTDMDALKVLYA